MVGIFQYFVYWQLWYNMLFLFYWLISSEMLLLISNILGKGGWCRTSTCNLETFPKLTLGVLWKDSNLQQSNRDPNRKSNPVGGSIGRTSAGDWLQYSGVPWILEKGGIDSCLGILDATWAGWNCWWKMVKIPFGRGKKWEFTVGRSWFDRLTLTFVVFF